MAGSLEHSLKKPLDSCCNMLKPLYVCLPTTILQHGSSCFFDVPLIAPPLPLRDAASTHTMETTPTSDANTAQQPLLSFEIETAQLPSQAYCQTAP